MGLQERFEEQKVHRAIIHEEVKQAILDAQRSQLIDVDELLSDGSHGELSDDDIEESIACSLPENFPW